jgi:enamine deaminase RidA (YjgF/YER057c/UK114 family)
MAGYTHKIWRIEAWNMHDALQKQIGAALDHMDASLKAVGAGRTQQAQSTRWITGNADLATEGRGLIGDHDPRLTNVSAEQAQAGGVDEVAAKKRYNEI